MCVVVSVLSGVLGEFGWVFMYKIYVMMLRFCTICISSINKAKEFRSTTFSHSIKMLFNMPTCTNQS